MAKCSLCQYEKGELHPESHIIPAFFWRLIWEEDGAPNKYSGEDLKEGKTENGIPSPEEYEHDILCSYCETLLNHHYEDYASKRLDLLKKGLLGEEKKPVCKDYGSYWRFENIDAGKIKLFFLSILWRASIAKTQKIYEEVNLDAESEERLREMIYYQDPGSDEEFPIEVHSYFGAKDLPETLIFKPKDLGGGVYLFILPGFILFFDTSGKKLPLEMASGQNQGLRIWKMSSEEVVYLTSKCYPLGLN